MRDAGETAAGGFDPVDRVLGEAGAAWRSTQPEPRPIDASIFAATSVRRVGSGRGGFGLGLGRSRWWAFLAGGASAVAVLAVVAIAAPNLLPRLGAGGGPLASGGTPGPSGAGPSGAYLPTGLANCPLTRPDGSFTPPPEAGVDRSAIEPTQAWYGTPKLWTLLHADGEVWKGLPKSELGPGQTGSLDQKTFWWREGYRPSVEATPRIFVTGNRLDGPGRFMSGPGTNASFGLGSTMLVGVEVPSPGCWQLTATYYDESLSYVVWVEDPG